MKNLNVNPEFRRNADKFDRSPRRPAKSRPGRRFDAKLAVVVGLLSVLAILLADAARHNGELSGLRPAALRRIGR